MLSGACKLGSCNCVQWCVTRFVFCLASERDSVEVRGKRVGVTSACTVRVPGLLRRSVRAERGAGCPLCLRGGRRRRARTPPQSLQLCGRERRKMTMMRCGAVLTVSVACLTHGLTFTLRNRPVPTAATAPVSRVLGSNIICPRPSTLPRRDPDAWRRSVHGAWSSEVL